MATLFDMDNKIKLAFYEKEGSHFEDFIVSLYKIKYPNLKAVKPQGAKGDGANDGYLSGELLLQVYAPEKIDAQKAIKKLEHDLQRAKDEDWKFKKYHFIINDKFKGALTDIHKKIDELQGENSNIEIELIDTETLKTMIYDLRVSDSLKIHVLLEMDKDISEFGDFELIATIIDFLANEKAIKQTQVTDYMNFSETDFLPDGITKLKINIEDEMFSKIFGTYIIKSQEVIEEFIPKIGLDEFEFVGDLIKKSYGKYAKKIVSEKALLQLHSELYKKMHDDGNLNVALWIVIAYFFDICDIGEIK